MESVDTRASEKSTSTETVSGISSIAATQSKRRLKTFNELNKSFDPGGREDYVPLPFFSCGEAGRLFVCLSGAKLGGFLSVSSMPCVCVCFPNLLFLSHR